MATTYHLPPTGYSLNYALIRPADIGELSRAATFSRSAELTAQARGKKEEIQEPRNIEQGILKAEWLRLPTLTRRKAAPLPDLGEAS
ncbi:MAG: hypothetical protein ACR2NP_13420 [Pirellulaceae bacterium]